MCVSPQTYRYQDEFRRWRTVKAACGHCIECLRDYQNGWKIRLSEEFAETCKGVFFTLTYAPESAPLSFDPETGEIIETDEYLEFMESNDKRVLSLRMEDVQVWLKRCRERYARTFPKDERPKWKYFICGEYGPRTLRPHYHGIFFGIDLLTFQTYFQNEWQKTFGFVDSSTIQIAEGKSPQRVANYVSKYCSKGSFENPRVQQGYVEKPRKLVSKGIGAAFADRIRPSKTFGYREVSIESPKNLHSYHFGVSVDLPGPLARDYHIKEDVSRLQLAELYFSPFLSPAHNPYEFATYIPKRTRVEPCAANKWRTSVPSLPRTYVRPLRCVVENIIDNMKVSYYDPIQNICYDYKMPRYLKNRIYGERSALSYEIKEVLQDRNDTLYSRQCKELQTRYPNWSGAEIDRYIEREEIRRRASSSENARKALNSFYQLSTI